MSVRILIGDCVQRMRELPDNSVDSVVCDPPYHLTSIVKRFSNAKPRSNCGAKVGKLEGVKADQYKRLARGFMGQVWDGGDVAFQPETWAEMLRVIKPGSHLIAFSGTRTYHRMVCAIEDAGFEIRDQLAWVFGSGFPKSHDAGDGWGTALKPAWEPICLARKPLIGTIAANKAEFGTGAINIDACRLEASDETIERSGEIVGTAAHDGYKRPGASKFTDKPKERSGPANTQGRWPANLCHDGSDEVVAGFPATESGSRQAGEYGGMGCHVSGDWPMPGINGDSGSAARFFYCAKATTDERGEGNNHPTVKPVSLMRWLVRLVTPKGGTVLDPFMGSGSTGIAADAEQFNFIGCELSADYAEIARRRIADHAGMFADISVEMTGPATRAA